MDILIARTEDQLERAHRRLAGADRVGCDTETSSLSADTGRLFSIQFSDGDFSVLVPVSEGVPPGPMAEILRDRSVVKVFHNARFDLDFLASAGLAVENVFCTMTAEKLITKGANQSASLSETLYRYFAIDIDKTLRKRFNRNWNGIWTDELVDYALSDVVHLPRLMTEQNQWLARLGLSDEFERQMEKTMRMLEAGGRGKVDGRR